MLLLDDIHTVVVGSKNPTKVQGIIDLFIAHTEDACVVQGIAAPSGVSDMPITFEETKVGARNRALRCKENSQGDMFVGGEGGVYIDENENAWLFHCMCFIDKSGYSHEVTGTQYMLPPSMSKRIIAGEELGPLADDILGESDIKKKSGVVGYLTKNYVPRKDSFLHTAYHGIIPWLHPELYS